ncbi:hypothetical protein [Caballeronia sp. J97]|uniref:hypothetical protein n=1 Tax=Caballeronia sp. J97 TaxID=2805429 RepID=UPI002AB2216D|nr:hypothetical protein [Caballeronia sp. J97]
MLVSSALFLEDGEKIISNTASNARPIIAKKTIAPITPTTDMLPPRSPALNQAFDKSRFKKFWPILLLIYYKLYHIEIGQKLAPRLLQVIFGQIRRRQIAEQKGECTSVSLTVTVAVQPESLPARREAAETPAEHAPGGLCFAI